VPPERALRRQTGDAELNFAFTAIDTAGTRRRGRRDAPTAGALAAALEQEGFFVVAISADDEHRAASFLGAWASASDRLEVTRTLAALLPAGLPLARGLDAAARLSSGSMAATLAEVRAAVERGESLAGALGAHPDVFPSHYVGSVRAGERSGDLAAAFARLSAQLEREALLRGRLLSASLYPLLLAIAGGAAVLVLLLVVLPNFAELLRGTGAQLPRSTALVLALSGALRRFWVAIPVVVLAALGALQAARATAAGRLGIARLVDGMPLVRGLRRELLAARFARLTGTLLAGGAPLLSALADAAASLGDPLAAAATARIRAAVRDGESLHRALLAEPAMPPMLAQLVAVGEESARLAEFLLKAAQLFEERSERAIQRLVALAEPAMIVVFGFIVGFVALSLLQAIYSINAGSFR
jgi:type II secretory pathway component PulF